jgi:hypothetical protein
LPNESHGNPMSGRDATKATPPLVRDWRKTFCKQVLRVIRRVLSPDCGARSTGNMEDFVTNHFPGGGPFLAMTNDGAH